MDYQLCQPTGVSVEFENVAYFTDYRTAPIKITLTLSHTCFYFEAIEKRMKAYSIHEKGTKMFEILFKYL